MSTALVNRGRLAPLYLSRMTSARGMCKTKPAMGELARELLNDWEAIWAVLSNPHLPITNNEAERCLRHWVIGRRISYGTRTTQGSRVVALLASVIETCRKRNVLPWSFLADVIARRRRGDAVPLLPAMAVA